MTPLPSKSTATEDFVPAKIDIKMRPRIRCTGSGGDVCHEGDNDGENNDNTTGQFQRQLSQASIASSAISPSVVFHEEDCELFDEIDDLYPHAYEGGEIVADLHKITASATASVSVRSSTFSHSRSDSSNLSASLGALGASGRNGVFASSLLCSLRSNSQGENRFAPTDYDSLAASSTDGTLAQVISGIEDRYKASTTLSQSQTSNRSSMGDDIYGSPVPNGNHAPTRASIVGGRQITDLSFEEQKALLAPERSNRSLVIADEDDEYESEQKYYRQAPGKNHGRELSKSVCSYCPTIPSENENENKNFIVSSVDWSSLSKSCKRAKNAFRDADSGMMVVKNMFITHLSALTTVLTLYAKRYCTYTNVHGGTPEEVKSRVTETKRVLRFALSCMAPPREDSGASDVEGGDIQEPSPTSAEAQDDLERYQTSRRYRQELQEVAVKGERSDSCHHYQGLQAPLVDIILAEKPRDSFNDNVNFSGGDADLVSSVEVEKQTVRILAARLLCNLVTDNPLAAEIVLRDVPFSPSADQIENRMSESIFGDKASPNSDESIFWSDLLDATAKVHTADTSGGMGKRGANSEDRDALAAVAAALHNLLTSLETREHLLELDGAMKRRENAKQRREVSRHDRLFSAVSGGSSASEGEGEQKSEKPIDVGFEVASNGPLLRSMLRNLLPAKAVLTQKKQDSRPKFKPPRSQADSLSDSATEWISLVLERLVSRGLLPQMLRSVGGAAKCNSVTQEQVVLVSCIRQAVDEYHSSLTNTGESGRFGRRRLSIAAKTAGMAVTTRPHPLWGRADLSAGGRVVPGQDSRTAVPVLLSLANEAEEFRLRLNSLREGKAVELYDGEQDCTIRVIDDICDILAQSFGRHAPSLINDDDNKQCFLADARSVVGRETPLISSCCRELGRILDIALERNSGKKTRELTLSSQEQMTAIVSVRLIGNLIHQCGYNQDLLRITPVPLPQQNGANGKANAFGAYKTLCNEESIERTGLHVLLSATSLAPACFTLREWCIVAIRNAVEGNAANAETVRCLEANEVVGDTPELRRIGVKVEMDSRGNVKVKRRESGDN